MIAFMIQLETVHFRWRLDFETALKTVHLSSDLDLRSGPRSSRVCVPKKTKVKYSIIAKGRVFRIDFIRACTWWEGLGERRDSHLDSALFCLPWHDSADGEQLKIYLRYLCISLICLSLGVSDFLIGLFCFSWCATHLDLRPFLPSLSLGDCSLSSSVLFLLLGASISNHPTGKTSEEKRARSLPVAQSTCELSPLSMYILAH